MKFFATAFLLFSLMLHACDTQAEVLPTPKDKAGHVVMGVVTYLGCRVFTFEQETCLNTAIGVALLKEAYDYSQPKKHSTELMDAAATAFGGLIMFKVERTFD